MSGSIVKAVNNDQASGGLWTKGSVKSTALGYPLVTVITVVYNGADSIEATIKSVLAQTYNNVEYIIVDGASKDATLEHIRRYDNRIDHWMSEPDKGIYDAMNKGIALAHGEWINFMNCGDRFASDTVLTGFVEKQNGADIIYGNAIAVYHTMQKPMPVTPLPEMWKRMPFSHQATFARTSVMQRFPFDLKYKLSSDFNFLYQAYRNNYKFQHIDLLISICDFRDGASLKNALRSITERRNIAFSDGVTLRKWTYYVWTRIYLEVSSFVKKSIGAKASEWFIKFLKR